MPTPLQLAAATGGARGGGGLSVYDPRLAARMPQGRQRAVAPTQRTGGPPSRPAQGNSARALFERATAKQQPKQEESGGGALGYLINSPLARAPLAILDTLDYGRRLATLGAEE